LTLTGNNANNGFVLVTNSVGVGSWMSGTTLPGAGTTPGGLQGAVQFNNLSNFGGDGTKFSFDGTNVCIGTAGPFNRLAVVGNSGVGVAANSNFVTTAAPSGGMIVEGNVGIGSTAPGTMLDVNGSIRTTGTNGIYLGSDNKALIVPSAATTPDLRFLT